MLPETIAVRYTEEEAEYLSVRPVRRQTFRIEELVDMVLSVTGKDLDRIRKILRSGSVVFNFYRYWWEGFDPEESALRKLVAQFPEADPSRVFRPGDCVAVVLESSPEGSGLRTLIELDRASASARRILRRESLWDALMELTRKHSPSYEGYSYARHGDMYHLELTPEQIGLLVRDAARLAPRGLRPQLRALAGVRRAIFVCPRPH